MGFAEQSPGLLEGINKPGIYIASEQLSNIEIDGKPLSGRYHRVSPSVYPPTDTIIEKISSWKSVPVKTDQESIATRAAEKAKLDKELQDAKTRVLNLKASLNGNEIQQTIELGKWEQAYITTLDGKIQTSGEAPGSKSRGVIAFLILCATLAYFALRKPAKTID